MTTEDDSFDYETFFKDGNWKIPYAVHSRFEQREIIKTKEGKTVELIEFKECPECFYPVKANDYHRSESVCENCGLVLDKQIIEADPSFFLGRTTEDLPDTKGGLRKDEQKAINKRYISTDKQEWRINQYYLFASNVINHFNMKQDQGFLLKSIINKYQIKKIHRNLNYEAVIIGIAIYILRQDGRLINYKQKFVRMNGLDKVRYKVIKRKLDKLNVFR